MKDRIHFPIDELSSAREIFWSNDNRVPWAEAEPGLSFHAADIEDAELRLRRFAPLIRRLFPETEESGGIIESELRDIPAAADALGLPSGTRLLIKLDSELPIAGSVKARGGIYEVLKHTEELALESGLLRPDSGPEEYEALADHRDFFGTYSVQVGSTGNLGLSIGIMSAAIGYRAVVHMSADAKQWKKDLLRSKGAEVIEYEGDYASAVAEGRRLSEADPKSYFVDDESSSSLYLGYSVAGGRLADQLEKIGISVDSAHKLAVYIPCGVGGAPGGICFGLKERFGDDVVVCFIEPVQAPCMLLGLASGKMNDICVQDIGLSGKTEADGLAVPRCSGLVSREMSQVLDACCTVRDDRLRGYMRLLRESSGIVIEPSSCAALRPLTMLAGKGSPVSADELRSMTHVIWATGGGLMPPEVVEEYLEKA